MTTRDTRKQLHNLLTGLAGEVYTVPADVAENETLTRSQLRLLVSLSIRLSDIALAAKSRETNALRLDFVMLAADLDKLAAMLGETRGGPVLAEVALALIELAHVHIEEDDANGRATAAAVRPRVASSAPDRHHFAALVTVKVPAHASIRWRRFSSAVSRR